MQIIDINIRALNFKLSLAHYEYIERRLSYALSVHVDQIAAVEVWLSQANHVAADYERRCLVQITLDDTQQIVIESADTDLNVAIHRAADQASWTIARHLGRRKIRSGTTAITARTPAAEACLSVRM